MNVLADMAREIGGLRFGQRKVEIQTGSLDGLVSAINRHVDLKPADVKGVSEFSFMGVKVIENPILPSDAAVIMSDGEIVNILRFG